MFEKLVIRDIMNYEQQKGRQRYNLSKVEYEALNTLQRDPSIIIKLADKGGAIVVMDRQVYESEARTQFS